MNLRSEVEGYSEVIQNGRRSQACEPSALLAFGVGWPWHSAGCGRLLRHTVSPTPLGVGIVLSACQVPRDSPCAVCLPHQKQKGCLDSTARQRKIKCMELSSTQLNDWSLRQQACSVASSFPLSACQPCSTHRAIPTAPVFTRPASRRMETAHTLASSS